MKINKIEFVGTHCIAGCNQCDWDASIFSEKTPLAKDVKRAARNHARKNNHSTWVEEGITTHFKPEGFEA